MLVTGATGALGRRLVPLLRERGWRVRALVHTREAAAADESIRGDLAEPATLSAALAGAHGVIHLAALTHARRRRAYETVNTHGTRALANAAREAGIERLVHVSTRAISPEGGWYSASKHLAEEEVRRSRVPHVIVRLPDVYGMGGDEGVDRLIDAVRAGRCIPMAGAGADELCPAHADDVVRALGAALESPAAAGRTYTLAGECVTFRAFVEACADALGVEAQVLPLPVPLVAAVSIAARVIPLPIYPDQLARLRAPKPAASPEAEAELGFTPRPLAAGLRNLRGAA